MATADRDEEITRRRFLRLAHLRRDVNEAARLDAAQRRLELALAIEAVRYRSLTTGPGWRLA